MKILAYTSPARGHLYPLVPILMSWLPAATRSPSGRWRQKIELMAARGFDAAPIAPAIEAITHDDYRARTPPTKLKRAMATFGARSRHEVADLLEAIDGQRPDAQRNPGIRRRATFRDDRRDAGCRAVAAVHDGRAVRIPALRLAGVRPNGGPVLLGAVCRSGGVARSDHTAARPGDHVLGVPGRRTSRAYGVGCARE